MVTQGEANGYFLPFECGPHFHGHCLERLLSLIPSIPDGEKSILDTFRARQVREEKAQLHTTGDYLRTFPLQANLGPGPLARFVKLGHFGPEITRQPSIDADLKQRMSLIGFVLEHESTLDGKAINEIFSTAFFETKFWMLWSTTFGLSPCHSAVEFLRHLRKYLPDLRSLNHIRELPRTTYNLVESVIQPLTAFLKEQGVDFRLNQHIVDIKAYPEGGPTTVSQIELSEESRSDIQECINLDPVDIVIATLGSTSAGAAFGSNSSPPAALTSNWEELLSGDWKLWEKLVQKSWAFGNPMNYLGRIQQATVEIFTTTFHGPQFAELYENVTHEKPGTGALLTLINSNWGLTISVPHQPVFSTQSDDETIMLGYALSPAKQGNFVKKEMWQCTGAEILREVLAHLGWTEIDEVADGDCPRGPGSKLLAETNTIPCGLPLGTAPFLSRKSNDRPEIVPKWSTNIACVGQFVEIPGDTTGEVDYSVHSAQIAVAELMGLPHVKAKVSQNLLCEVFDLLM